MVAREEFQKLILLDILYIYSKITGSNEYYINTRRYFSIGSQKYVPSMATRNIFQELFSRNVSRHWLPRIHSNNRSQEFFPRIALPEYIPILAHLDIGS
jgi:hypothetical protein